MPLMPLITFEYIVEISRCDFREMLYCNIQDISYLSVYFLDGNRTVVALQKELVEGRDSERFDALWRAKCALAKREKIATLNGLFCLLGRADKTVKNDCSQRALF